jgi:hypothetical protein
MKRTIICLLVVAALHDTTSAHAPVARALSAAWSLPGRWTGVVGDERTGAIYTIGWRRAAELNVAGEVQHEFQLPPDSGSTLRLARFPQPTLITFTSWGATGLSASDLGGHPLWNYLDPDRIGLDDVWAGDLDGDDSDEVILGYNGGGGVHVLDANGRLRWKSTAIGNVWHVAVGDVLGQGRPQVVTTSALGRVHVFDGDGTVDVVSQRAYLTMVRVQKLRMGDSTAAILVAGSNRDSKVNTVMALTRAGAAKWALELSSSVRSAMVASSRPWLALGTRDGQVSREGQVFVIDDIKGEVIGVASGQGNAEVGWVGNPPLLLVATGASLNAFRIEEQ